MDGSKSEKERLRDELISQESVIGTFFGSVIGAVPGFVVYLLFLMQGFPSFLATIIPGVFAGFGARYLGRGILDKHSRIAAIVVFTLHMAFWWLAQLPLMAIGLAIPSAVVALFLAPRKLTHEQELAVYEYRIGRWSPDVLKAPGVPD